MQNMKNSKEIKERINNLHETGSGDYESLLKQVDSTYKRVAMNLPQMAAYLSNAPIKVLEWGRGTGKTTYRGAHWSKLLKEMPRSSGVVPAATYKDMLTNIIPSLINGLEMFGLFEGLHYFIGERPPRAWRKSWGTAYQPPKKFEHYISFWNGMGAHLLSQDVKGDGRGLNSDWMDVDEAAKLNALRLQEDVDPTMRGTNVSAFKKSNLFGSRLITTSVALDPEGAWYQRYEEQAHRNPKKVTFIKATCEYNAHNLREGFLEEAESNAFADWVFEAEYKNKRPKFVSDGFYALLSEDQHAYNDFNYHVLTKVGQAVDCRSDNDLVKGQPLILSMDFGAAINCMSVNQHLATINEYRTIKDFYVLGDERKIQEDLITDFNKYYEHHKSTCADLFIWYDNSGNNATGITRATRAEQVRQQLLDLGWRPRLMTVGGSNPLHELKHRLWQRMLSEDTLALPRYRINRSNCPSLWISMRTARTTQSRTGLVQKNKSVEKSKKVPRNHATDLSDANDAAIWGMFGRQMMGFGAFLPETSVTTL